MGYRPHPPDAKIESTLIWYRWDPQLENQEKNTKRGKRGSDIFANCVLRHGKANGNWNGTKQDIGWYGRLKNDLKVSLHLFFVVGVSVDGDVIAQCFSQRLRYPLS